jgi:cytochrome c556
MTTKVTIHGVPRKFEQAELEQRQQGFHTMYKTTDQCCTMVHGEIAFDFIAKLIKMSDEGYTLTNKYPVSCSPMSYHAHMIKPESVQQTDLAVIDQQVKDKYVSELEEEHQKYKQLLTQQLIDAAALKDQKKIADAQAKRMAEIQAEVDNVFKPLSIPT